MPLSTHPQIVIHLLAAYVAKRCNSKVHDNADEENLTRSLHIRSNHFWDVWLSKEHNCTARDEYNAEIEGGFSDFSHHMSSIVAHIDLCTIPFQRITFFVDTILMYTQNDLLFGMSRLAAISLIVNPSWYVIPNIHSRIHTCFHVQ